MPNQVIQAVEEDENLEQLLSGAEGVIAQREQRPEAGSSLSNGKNTECKCESRRIDEEQKEEIQGEINRCYEDIIQLEKALIELDEQNTYNALEIRKKEAKNFLLERQISEYEEHKENQNKFQNEIAFINKHMNDLNDQIQVLQESTKQNLIKRKSMKDELFESY